jgi:hypothetical protein
MLYGIAERIQKQGSAEADPGRSKNVVGVLSSYCKYNIIIIICQVYKKLFFYIINEKIGERGD